MVDLGHIGGPIVIPSTAVITFRWGLADQKVAHNVLYGHYAGSFSGSAAQATAIHTALSTGATWTALAAHFATDTTFAGVDIRDVNTANNAIVSSTSASVAGTGTGQALPNEVAVALTLRTARTGPRYRGRIFIPVGVAASIVVGNAVAPALVTALTNWGGAISGAFAAQGYTFCLGLPARAEYTGRTGTLHPARPAEFPTVTSVLCRDNHWDSMRRRGLR